MRPLEGFPGIFAAESPKDQEEGLAGLRAGQYALFLYQKNAGDEELQQVYAPLSVPRDLIPLAVLHDQLARSEPMQMERAWYIPDDAALQVFLSNPGLPGEDDA